MAHRPTYLLDPSHGRVAILDVSPFGDHFQGTVDLASSPLPLRTLFRDYEDVVEGQVFSRLDAIEEKVAAASLQVEFDDGTVADVEDLQVFPTREAISFKARR